MSSGYSCSPKTSIRSYAAGPDHPFRTKLFGDFERRRVRIGDALRQAIMIAQVDEQDTAMVADAMAPAGQTNVLADIALSERAAGVGPVTMHRISISQMSENRATSTACPKRLRV